MKILKKKKKGLNINDNFNSDEQLLRNTFLNEI